jgi:DNA-binding transcriptional regulator YdaS (Cro superfamily)
MAEPKPLHPVPAALRDLWQSLKPKLRLKLAKAADTSPGTMRQYVEGRRGISTAVAARIEQATKATRGVPRITRTQLNETCRTCEYAITCEARRAKWASKRREAEQEKQRAAQTHPKR